MPSHYRGDPYWLTAKYAGTCRRCGRPIRPGEHVFYYPKTKSVYCSEPGCGEKESNSFHEAVQDEDFYNGYGG